MYYKYYTNKNKFMKTKSVGSRPFNVSVSSLFRPPLSNDLVEIKNIFTMGSQICSPPPPVYIMDGPLANVGYSETIRLQITLLFAGVI